MDNAIHAWNQVKIDGKWYNADLTWDMDGIKLQKEVEEGGLPYFPKDIKFLEYCLKGSENFADRKIIEGKCEECEKNDYDINELYKFFNYDGNEPIVKINGWDRLKNKIKQNNKKLLPEANRENKIYSQYATTGNPDEIIHLSKIARASMELDDKFVLTRVMLEIICEETMDTAKKLSEDQAVFINATKKDAEILKDYIDSGMLMLKVNGERLIYDKDYINYVERENNKNALIDITMDKIKKFGYREELRDKRFCLIIYQDEFDKLSDKQVKNMFKRHNVDLCVYRMNDILNVDTEKLLKYKNMEIYYKDADYPEYGPAVIEEIKDQVRAVIYDVKDTDSELEKFTKVYTKILENITYDYSLDELFEKQDREEEFTEEEEDLLIESQNLTGLLTRNYSMCRVFKNIAMYIK